MDNWIDLWTAAAAATVGSVTNPLSPISVARWVELISVRTPPRWASPHTIAFETPIARLRDFSTEPGAAIVPTLVLPPQAGHDSCIVDFSSAQSQMRTIIASGHVRAMTLDWIGATSETKDTTIDDYLEVIDTAVEYAGGRVNLIGDCQGGWLATIYAALAPERVNTLTIAGAPIDFHAGEPIIHDLLRKLAPGGSLAFYEALVASGGGVLKGDHMLGGFVTIKPVDEFKRQLELLHNLDDAGHVERYIEFEDWFKHSQDIPGRFYLWIVEHLFRDNELVRGRLEVRGQKVDLRKLTMPLNLLAGAADHITPPDQVFTLAHVASTPPELIRCEIADGGHLGLFMGHEALNNHWPSILAATLAHSR